MSGWLWGKSGRVNSTDTIATSLRVQTSIQGKPRAIGAGKNRLAGNLIWYGGFTAIPAPQSGGGKGGGGGGGKGQANGGQYNYYVSAIVSIGEGPINRVTTIYNGNTVDFLEVPPPQILADLAALGITPNFGPIYNSVILNGSYTQEPWPYVVTFFPGQARAYRGEAVALFGSLNLGSSPSLPNFNFEVVWGQNSDIPALGPDANAADWIVSFLSNADWGAGFPAALISDLAALRTYSRATSMLISPVLSEQTAANAHLRDLMTGLACDFRWSNGLLDVIPYADQPVTGNGTAFTPDVTPIYDLTADHFLPNQGTLGSGSSSAAISSIAISRADPLTILNKVQIEYLDRSNLYNPVTIYATDDASIIDGGLLRLSDLRSYHFFCLAAAASTSVALQLARAKVAVTYQFTLPAQFVLLDPMDVVTVTEPALGLDRQAVRITEIQENDDRSLTFTAEELLGTVGAPLYGRQASTGAGRNNNVDPGLTNTPVIFEPPDELGNGLEIWGAVSGVDSALWGGCFVWASYEEAGTYAQIGEIIGPSRHGVTTAALPSVARNLAGQTIDNVHALAVDLSISKGALESGSVLDMTSLNTACYVDGEIIAYQTATLTATSRYTLAPLVRGAFGSKIGAHAAGGSFARLDGAIFKLPYTADRIGATLYLKFLSYNIYGGGLQTMDAVGAYSYVITGSALASPLPDVANLRTVYDSGFMRLYWDELNDFRSGIRYKIRQGDSWAAALEVADVAHPGVVIYGDGQFWVSAYCLPAPGLVVYSEMPTPIMVVGNMLVANIIRTSDQKADGWKGSFVNAGVEGSVIRLYGAGDILTDPDILGTPDVLNYGGVSLSGSYTIPAGDIVDVGYVANCPINVTWQGTGAAAAQNILSMADVLSQPDILAGGSAAFVSVFPLIQIDPGTGTFGDWQKFVPGTYLGRRFNFMMALSSVDNQTIAYCLAFQFQVTVPPRIDHYQNLTVPDAGLAIAFQPDGAGSPGAFNGGPNGSPVPYINVSYQNQPGDALFFFGESLSGVTLQIQNGGIGVTRTGVNLNVEGY